MSDIAEQLARLAQGIAFPARLRLFVAEGVAVPASAAGEREWPRAHPAELLAAACGAAWAEARRGGRVAVVVAPEDQEVHGWAAARALAGLLAPGNLHILPAARAAPAAGPAPDLRREWQPVRLASLPMGGLPPWPVDGDGRAMEAWLQEREPRFLPAHRDPSWSRAAPGPALLVALGQLASEGLRVCWRVPAEVRLGDLLAGLLALGRRGLGVKLIVDEVPSAGLLAALAGWWVWSPADAGELAAVLANVLDHEEPALVVLPAPRGASAGIAPWPAAQAAVAGDGRVLVQGGALTVVAAGRGAGHALALAQALGGAGAFACSCLAPLPVAELARLAAQGPLVVLDEDLARAVSAALAPSGGGRVLALPAETLVPAAVARVRAEGW